MKLTVTSHKIDLTGATTFPHADFRKTGTLPNGTKVACNPAGWLKMPPFTATIVGLASEPFDVIGRMYVIRPDVKIPDWEYETIVLPEFTLKIPPTR